MKTEEELRRVMVYLNSALLEEMTVREWYKLTKVQEKIEEANAILKEDRDD